MLKRTIWHCYAITFILLAEIFLGGRSNAFSGGGYTYRLLSFYVVIPAALFIIGGILGFKDAYLKWLYPVISGILTRVVVLQFANLQVGLHFLPFMFAFCGMISGTTTGFVFRKLNTSAQTKLKKITLAGGTIGLAIMLIHIVHAATLDRIIDYRELHFSSPNIPAEMDGYRVAFISDIHNMPMSHLEEVVAELNRRHIDLLILGGDFPPTDTSLRRSIEILSQTITTDGIFGVDGNHDNYAYLFEAMQATGITPLSNSGVAVRDNFFLAGVEDLCNRNPSIADAIANSTPEDFVLLISHNPDVAMKQDTAGVDLIMSGHTHGGHITFFGVWAPYFTFSNSISEYGQRFVSGWAKSRDGTPVLVSNGLHGYILRVFARPQVILLTLVSEE